MKQAHDPSHYRERAEKMRELARETSDPENKRMILKLAKDYEMLANEAEARSTRTATSILPSP